MMTIQKHVLVIPRSLLFHPKSSLSFYFSWFWFFGPIATALNRQHTIENCHCQKTSSLLADPVGGLLPAPWTRALWKCQQKHTPNLFFPKIIILQLLLSRLIWPPSYLSLKLPVHPSPSKVKHRMHWVWLDTIWYLTFLHLQYSPKVYEFLEQECSC